MIPFPQMAIALSNKAVDAAIVISPFWLALYEKDIAFELTDPDRVIEKGPFGSALVFVNTDWAQKNPELVRAYHFAHFRGGAMSAAYLFAFAGLAPVWGLVADRA